MTKATTFHRLERMRPRGGNQWYRDKSPRTPTTLCGAPVSGYDRLSHDRAPFKDWTRDADGQTFTACADCSALAEAAP